jgi:hypothetical protein
MKKNKILLVAMLLLFVLSFAFIACPMDSGWESPNTNLNGITEIKEEEQQEKNNDEEYEEIYNEENYNNNDQQEEQNYDEEKEEIQEEENDEEPIAQTIFEGTWTTNIYNYNSVFMTLEFIDNKFIYFSNSTGMYFKSGSYTGTFEFTKNIITLTTDDMVFTMYYTIRNNGILILENSGNNRLFYAESEILTKQ